MRIFLALLFLFACYIITEIISNSNDTIYTYKEYIDVNDENTYRDFIINVENIYVTTRNISKYLLNDMKLIALLPKLNDLYTNYYSSNWYYFDINNYNIDRYETRIMSILKDHGFIDDSNMITLDGIRIKEIIVNTSYKNIEELKNKYKLISIT